MSPRIVSNLNMANPPQIGMQNVGQFAFHALGVIDVILQIGIRMPDFVEYFEYFGSGIQGKADHILGIEMFDEKSNPRLLERLSCKPKVLRKHPTLLSSRHVGKGSAYKAVDLWHTAQRNRIVDRQLNARLEFGLACGVDGNASFTGNKVASGQIKENDFLIIIL